MKGKEEIFFLRRGGLYVWYAVVSIIPGSKYSVSISKNLKIIAHF